MDVTTLARTLIEPVPAHAAAGLEVLRAADGAAQVTLAVQPTLTNVIGSLHSSGLITLADAAAWRPSSPPVRRRTRYGACSRWARPRRWSSARRHVAG